MRNTNNLTKARKTVVEAVASTTAVGEEDEEEEDAAASGTQLSLHGSLGPNYSGESDLFYSQFELHTREEKLSQIVLVKVGLQLRYLWNSNTCSKLPSDFVKCL